MEKLQIQDPVALRDTQEWIRVTEELTEYFGRGMYSLLQYMIYLVDFMRENDIVWGVGRGSSVASYVLYLIGVHKINSIQYDLDWREFLR
jgi:DNA polymerase III alpha subunit